MQGMSLPRLLGTEDTSVTDIPCDKFIEAGEHVINDVNIDFFIGNKYYGKNRKHLLEGIGSASGVAQILNKAVPYFPRPAVTTTECGLKKLMYYLTVLEAICPKSRCW